MNFIDLISEEVNAKISAKTKKLLKSQETRESMKEEFGETSFLDPDNKKFPIVNPTTGKIDCKLIYAAYMRARIHFSKGGSSKAPADYYKKIAENAKELYNTNNCSKKVGAKLEEGDDKSTVDLIFYTENFTNEVEFSKSKNLFFEFVE
jgi:hypothetical protein